MAEREGSNGSVPTSMAVEFFLDPFRSQSEQQPVLL